jgi:Protein of unknown function (DUF1553)/Protein of unknown function (DUF1549)/Planctomycete cytochrome C
MPASSPFSTPRFFPVPALLAAGAIAFCAVSAFADGPNKAQAGPPIDFNRLILPVLADNCYACHGPDSKQRKAKLRLDTKEGAFGELRGGRHAIVANHIEESELVRRITASDPSEIMPPPKTGKKLAPEQINHLKRWIEQGASWSAHWAFVAPSQHPLPQVADRSWPRNPIDRFILARLQAEHLTPSPEADQSKLIRRLTLDLTGLPPTPAEVDAFLADTSPRAYEKLVDRLLASPRYGEHMTRYWLDLARYGDTHGLHLDNFREMWPYRDWLIKAFNANLPYDRFVIEQLAGDMLPNATLDQIVASGFNRCHVTTSEGGSIDEECYVRNVVDRVDTTGVVFLGLTTGCARCHDHKYDPLTMKDYYQLFAIFNSLDEKPLDGNAARPSPIAYVPTPEQAKTLAQLQRKVSDLTEKVSEAAVKVGSGDRTDANESELVQRFEKVAALSSQAASAVKERVEFHRKMPATLISRERKEPRPAYILKRGEYDRRGEQVGRNTPAFLPPLPLDAPRNRLGFAQWLVSPNNPLTARVAVNRFWQQCFGTGLVKTSEDFGTQGEPPSHPELLDWLAVRFRDDGWDMKKLMKMIVMSATYRQSSAITPDRLAKDPVNRLLSHGPRFRLDAEMLRDQALFVSGLLVEHQGGPSVKPPQPYGLWEAVGYVTSNTRNFVADTGEKVHRRSLYTFWKRTAPPPQMNTFDAPSREACTARRERTNTPLQALLILNETQYVECARAMAERALRECGPTHEARIKYLFRLATARAPDSKELAELAKVYRDYLVSYTDDRKAAGDLINVGESRPDPALNPSELAAWTMVANLILNLDEVLNKG